MVRPGTIAVLKEAVEALVRMLVAVRAAHGGGTVGAARASGRLVAAASWPDYDEEVAKAEEIVVPVQVNGSCARG